MPTQPGKSSFTRAEIVEILRQNLDLFRHEPKFVDYFIELTLYLVDQAYHKRGERVTDIDSVMEKYQAAVLANQTPPPPPPFERPSGSFSSSEPPRRDRPTTPPASLPEPEHESDRPTNKLRLAALQAVMKAPPPPDSNIDPGARRDKSTDRLNLAQLGLGRAEQGTGKPSQPPTPSGPMGRPEAFDLASQVEEDDLEDPLFPDAPGTRQLSSPAALTPEPEGGLTKEKRGIEMGRAQVHRSAGPGPQARRGPSNCPICGSSMGGKNVCPSCGHIA